MILHIPHADPTIPPELRGQFSLPVPELQEELLRSTDWFTDELFTLGGCPVVRFPVSRLVVDPERFENDASEPMSAVGRGAVYHSTKDGLPLRRHITPKERATLLRRIYHPHHARLSHVVRSELARDNKALLVDAHSFPAIAWRLEQSPGARRPDFCIGTDRFHTPAALTGIAHTFLVGKGFSVAENEPYDGSLVPMAFYRRDPRVASIMIEVNRRTYMDEERASRGPQFSKMRAVIEELLQVLYQFNA